MDENIQQSPVNEQPVEQQPAEPAGEQEFNFTDEDLAFAQWSLTLGAYMQSLLSDPARAAEEFEAVARSLREQFQQPEPQQPEPEKQAEPQQPSQSQNPTDINTLVQQAVEQAVSKMFEQMRKQALASPAGLSGRAVSSRRLADLIE